MHVNRFKKFDGLIDKNLKKEIFEGEDSDLGISFYPEIDYDFLRENASIITRESFVYMYSLSDEEREYVDSVRRQKENILSLKK